jgi:hypothetical protein
LATRRPSAVVKEGRALRDGDGREPDIRIVDSDVVRTHQGRWSCGRTLMQTFLDTLPIAKEHSIAV